MFRTVPLSIIRSYSLYSRQWCVSYRFVDSFRAGSWWNSVHFQNKFEKLLHLVGFIIRKFVTMHGHMSRCTVTCHDARSHECEKQLNMFGLTRRCQHWLCLWHINCITPSLLDELFVIRWLQQLVSNVAAPDWCVRGIDTRKFEVEFKKEIIALNPQTSFFSFGKLGC
jgi:hypothetical protein